MTDPTDNTTLATVTWNDRDMVVDLGLPGVAVVRVERSPETDALLMPIVERTSQMATQALANHRAAEDASRATIKAAIAKTAQDANGGPFTAKDVLRNIDIVKVDMDAAAAADTQPVQPPNMDIEIACAWSDYREGYGASGVTQHQAFAAGYGAARDPQQHKAFLAGWEAANDTLDAGGPQR